MVYPNLLNCRAQPGPRWYGPTTWISRGGLVDLPKRLSQRSAATLLSENGWVQERGGKHVVKMTKPGMRPVTLPAHKGQDYSVGLTRAILKQAGLTSPPGTE